MKNKTIKQEESQEQVETRIRRRELKEKRRQFVPISVCLLILSSGLVPAGFFIIKAARTEAKRHEENTFIFKAKCNDIDRYSEAFFVKPNLLNLDPINDEFRKNCQPLHYTAVKPGDCLLEYNKFKEYTVKCSLTNLENFEKRYVRPTDCRCFGMFFGGFLMVSSIITFIIEIGWLIGYFFNIESMNI